MATFALLGNDNKVFNIIVAETLEIAESVTQARCVEYTELNPAGIEDRYDADTNTFIKPE
jgi:hypothetical protein